MKWEQLIDHPITNHVSREFVIAIDSVIGPLANESEHCRHYVR
jgi:hypothetical protein